MGRKFFILYAAVLILSGGFISLGCNRPFDPVNPLPPGPDPTPTFAYPVSTSVAATTPTPTATP